MAKNPMKPTIAEWFYLTATGLSLGPTLEHSWPLVLPLGGIGLGIYALRRSQKFEDFVLDKMDDLEDRGAPDWAVGMLANLTVPRAGEPVPVSHQLPAGSAERGGRPTHQDGPQGIFSLWGDDDPRKVARSQSQQIAVRPGRPRNSGMTRDLVNRQGQVTRQLAAIQDEDWLHQDAVDVMPIKEMVTTINGDPDTYPFVIVFGPPRSGKTTLAQLIVAARKGRVVILDPKRPQGWKEAKWGGLPYVTKDREGSYQPMIDALQMGYDLMEWRYKHQEEATREYEPVTFIIDEAQVTAKDCPEIAALYKAILSKGAEARVLLVLTSTTDRARALGFEGTADNLEGFVPIRLGNFAKKVLPEVVDVTDDPHHWAAVNFGEWQAFDNSQTVNLLRRAKIRKSAVWAKVEYNCQVPNWDREPEVEEPAPDPVRVERRPQVVSAAKRPAPTQAIVPTGWKVSAADEALLASMLSKYGRGEVSSEVLSEVPNGVPNGEVGTSQYQNSLPSTSNALHSTSRAEVQEAANLLKTMSDAEQKSLREVLLLLAVGTNKTPAITQVTGQTGGKVFSRMAQLVNAALVIKEAAR